MSELFLSQARNQRSKRQLSSAVINGHLLPYTQVITQPELQQRLSKQENIQKIEIPTKASLRAKFLRKWAKDQGRRAASGVLLSSLIVPLFAAEAQAQDDGFVNLSDVGAVADVVFQADGNLLITLNDGETILVPDGEYLVTAEGQILVEAEALSSIAIASTGAMGVVAAGGLALAGLGAAGGGGSGGGSSDGSGGDSSSGGGGSATAPTTTGFVVDGYIRNALVFRDDNENGILDNGEVSTRTDDNGAFELSGEGSGPIISSGGTDISTGLAFTGTLKAPAGSSIVSPITTLIQELTDDGVTSVEAATAKVSTILGISTDVDVLNVDPIASENSQLFAAGVKVVNLISLGTAAGASEDAVVDALVAEINRTDVGDPNPLNNLDKIQEVLTEALDGATSKSDLGVVAETITNANDVVDQKANADDFGDVANQVADVQQALQTEVKSKIENGTLNEALDQDAVNDAADNAQDIQDGKVVFADALIESDTDLSDFELEIDFTEDAYVVAEGVIFQLTPEQADGLAISGKGVVVIAGSIDDIDVKQIDTLIGIPGQNQDDEFFVSLSVDDLDGATINLPSGINYSLDFDFNTLDDANPSLLPMVDLSGVSIGQPDEPVPGDPVSLFEAFEQSDPVAAFKLLWNYGDAGYYDAFPDGSPEVNAAFVDIGNLYAEYLIDGGDPIFDVVQTKVSGQPNFAERQQTLHDNLLGNVNSLAIESREKSGDLVEDNRNESGKLFGDRPYHDGELDRVEDKLASEVWDIANGFAVADNGLVVGAGEIYVLNGSNVVDADDSLAGINPFTDLSEAIGAAGKGAYILIGSGTYVDTLVLDASITITALEGAVLSGGIRIQEAPTSGEPSFVDVNVSGLTLEVTGQVNGAGFYLAGDDVVLNLKDVNILESPSASGPTRGILNEIGSEGEINVSGGTFVNLTSGIYLNPGATLSVDDAIFDGNTAGIGTDNPLELEVVNSVFKNNGEAIGLSGDVQNESVTLSDNVFEGASDEVNLYFVRGGSRTEGPQNPVAIPEELQGVTIAKADQDVAIGTDGSDLFVDSIGDTVLELDDDGGSDFVLLFADGSGEANTIRDFKTGTDEDADTLAFSYDDENATGALRGEAFQVLSEGDALASNTGFIVLSEALDLSLADGDEASDAEMIFDALEPFIEGASGGVLLAVSDDTDGTVLLNVDLDADVDPENRIEQIAILEDVAATSLSADNLYDFSVVTANT